MSSIKEISSYFDISVGEQIEALFQSVTSDKVFVFSGPPKFDLVKDSDRYLCPLLFTTNINIGEGRSPGQRVGGLGTVSNIDGPSTQSSHNISIGSYAAITGTPANTLSGESHQDGDSSGGANLGENKYNLLKRVYFDAINFRGGELLDFFLPDSQGDLRKSKVGFNPVASSAKDMFSNFGKSEFYEIPFGVLVITLTKSHSHVMSRYFEGCKLRSPGSLINASVGGSAFIQNGMALSFKDEIPLEADDISGDWFGNKDYSEFIDVLKAYSGANK